MRDEIRIAGFGGQGVITIGILLAKAAGGHGTLEVAQTQSYGPEARGGACKTDVVISDAPIDYIKPLDLKRIVVMAQPALDAYGPGLADDALIIADSGMVTAIPSRFSRVVTAPVTSLAEGLGMKLLANVCMFGVLAKTLGWVTREQAMLAIADQIPAKFLEKNHEAFDLGYSYPTQETK